MDELDGDVLGIRAPSAIAERDELAASSEPGRHRGGRTADRLRTFDEGQARFAAAGKGISNGAGCDWSGLRSANALHGCTPKPRAGENSIGHTDWTWPSCPLSEAKEVPRHGSNQTGPLARTYDGRSRRQRQRDGSNDRGIST
jgi:hypothetical protein